MKRHKISIHDNSATIVFLEGDKLFKKKCHSMQVIRAVLIVTDGKVWNE